MLAIVSVTLATVLAWHPWTHASMAKATTVLPATAAAPPGKDDVLAIVFSGDGGWRDLDKQLGGKIAAHGIPVLGVSALEYYWHGGSAERTAADLDALMTDYLARWHKRRVWLIGFSFGADVLPTVIEQLPAVERARVAQLVLLSPTRDLNFEIELEGYMRENWLKTTLKAITERVNPVPHYPALPPLLALQGHPPVSCYYGEEERDDTVCAQAPLPAWVTVHPMPGDHHLGGDYDALAGRLLDAVPVASRSGQAPHP